MVQISCLSPKEVHILLKSFLCQFYMPPEHPTVIFFPPSRKDKTGFRCTLKLSKCVGASSNAKSFLYFCFVLFCFLLIGIHRREMYWFQESTAHQNTTHLSCDTKSSKLIRTGIEDTPKEKLVAKFRKLHNRNKIA